MKVKGKEYPISLFKLVLADPIVNKLEFIRNYLKLPNNIEAFTVSINTCYGVLIAAIKAEEESKLKENKNENS